MQCADNELCHSGGSENSVPTEAGFDLSTFRIRQFSIEEISVVFDHV